MHRAERVREILATRDLTLYSVSERSAQLFGRSSRLYIPHNLFYDTARSSLIPTIHQMFALSRITNYRLVDWIAAFGCDLDEIPRLQLLMRRPRTMVLDSSVYDAYAWVPWFAGTPNSVPVVPIAPLGRFLATAAPKQLVELLSLNKRRFLYGKIGEGDLYAVPYLAPGTIVRVDTERKEDLLFDRKTSIESPFFLVEFEHGYTCSRLIVIAKERVLLHSPQRPCAQRELRLGRDARILGVIDAEIRPVTDCSIGDMTGSLRLQETRPVSFPNPGTRLLKDVLRAARTSAGLSFREASFASRWIKKMLSDPFYFAAPSTLSDYETLSEPPRHIQKVMTLSILYGIEFSELIRFSGLPLGEAGRDPMPNELVPRKMPRLETASHEVTSEERDQIECKGFLGRLLQQWEEIPLFLRHSLDELTGLKKFSLSDVFWVGGDTSPIHPLLTNATFVAVNRRMKRPIRSASEAFCAQSIYVIFKRNGGYLCGHCTLDRTDLIVHSYLGGTPGMRRFRIGLDAEVIGRVTTVLRRLP
jgi:hypothetical protein